jgi:hypothetical protein
MGLPRSALSRISRRIHSHVANNARTYSTDVPGLKTRPYTFHVGVAYAGKPPARSKRRLAAFPSDHRILEWKNEMLAYPWKTGYGPNHVRKDAGEDFYYVQEVRRQLRFSFTSIIMFMTCYLSILDARAVGR